MDEKRLAQLKQLNVLCQVAKRAALFIFVPSLLFGTALLADIAFIPGDYLLEIGPSYKGALIGWLMAISTALYGGGYTISERIQRDIITMQGQQEEKDRQKSRRRLEEQLAFPGEVLRIERTSEPSENVLILQLILSLSGHPLLPDGLFGDKTRSAVIAAQSAFGIKEDGEAGKITWTTLAEEVRRLKKGEELIKLYDANQPRLQKARKAIQSPTTQHAQTPATKTQPPKQNL